MVDRGRENNQWDTQNLQFRGTGVYRDFAGMIPTHFRVKSGNGGGKDVEKKGC